MTKHRSVLLAATLLGLGQFASAEDFLPAEQAFAFSNSASEKTLEWHWQLAPGYSLYRDRIHVKVLEPSTVQLAELHFPQPIIHQDEFFGPQAVYTNELTLSTPVHCALTAPTPITIEVRYQGCADAGLCYPPETRTVSLTLSPAICSG